jgi:AsmA family
MGFSVRMRSAEWVPGRVGLPISNLHLLLRPRSARQTENGSGPCRAAGIPTGFCERDRSVRRRPGTRIDRKPFMPCRQKSWHKRVLFLPPALRSAHRCRWSTRKSPAAKTVAHRQARGSTFERNCQPFSTFALRHRSARDLRQGGSRSKPRRWILGALAAVAAALTAILILFDWNWLKGPIKSQVSAALGRPFRITGDLDVDLSLEPRITIEGAELANASWGSDTPMAKFERAEVLVDVLKLHQGELVLPEVKIIKSHLLLEILPNGPSNWQFGEGAEPSQGPPVIPVIGRFEVSDASIRYHDFGNERNITAELARIAGSTGSPEGWSEAERDRNGTRRAARP